MDFKNKKAIVCGMARSGVSAALLLKELGADVTLQDIKEREQLENIEYLENKGIKMYLGKNPDDIIEDMDFAVVSPGIPTGLPFFDIAKKAGVDVISEVELSYIVTPCPIAAVTGTNGKTTTTALAGEIIKKKYPSCAVVGNIGVPYSGEVSRLTVSDYVVAEISSFQLETSCSFHPHISAVLNITPDHLDRHKTVENYTAIKEKIFANQNENDFLILNYNDCLTRKMAEKTKSKILFFSSNVKLDEGIYIENGNIILKRGSSEKKLMNVEELKVLGVHNYENVMAAIAIGICAEVDMESIIDAVKNFSGVEHRIEFVRTYEGVDYYNDSKGTNCDAAIRGIMAMQKPCVLIGGGYDKGAKYDEWVEKFDEKVKHIILIGATADKIAKCCESHGFTDFTKAGSLKEAVELSRKIAHEGDCVLLSPACASWDSFKSYEERGELFKNIVNDF